VRRDVQRRGSAATPAARRRISLARQESIRSLGPHVLEQARIVIDLVNTVSIIVFRKSIIKALRT
jgi:hypothetical protein